MATGKVTGKKAASEAAQVLRDTSVTKEERSAAGSTLSQAAAQARVTGERVASEAARVLRDPHATKAEKSVAGSDLTQRPSKKRG